MTLAEAQAELAKLNAAIDRITGTTTAGGAQDYQIGSTRVQRASLDTLYERKRQLEIICQRLASGNSGGAVRFPVFGTRS